MRVAERKNLSPNDKCFRNTVQNFLIFNKEFCSWVWWLPQLADGLQSTEWQQEPCIKSRFGSICRAWVITQKEVQEGQLKYFTVLLCVLDKAREITVIHNKFL